MGSKTARAERQRQREDNTAQLMENIMTGGEISKAREAELQKAANYGRGVQLLPPSTTVQGLTQAGGQPVMLTNPNFQPRIVANQPTLGEAGGDIVRGLFGGQAERPIFTSPDAPPTMDTGMDFANMVPAPERTQGIIPALINTGGIGGLALNLIKDLYSSGAGKVKDFLSPAAQPQPDPFSSGADATGGAFTLAQSLVPQNIERENIAPVDKRARLKELIERDVAPGSQELNVDGMTDQEVNLRLQSYGEPLAMGGLIPPESGPQSEGIESLFKNK
jgi:hypothetical protein